VFAETLALLDQGRAASAFRLDEGTHISGSRFVDDIAGAAVGIADSLGRPADPCVWVSARDRYVIVTAAIGGLSCAPVALVDPDSPLRTFSALAESSRPSLLVTDDRDSGAARWATAARVPVCRLTRADFGRPVPPSTPVAERSGTTLRVFTSGTTGVPKCVHIGGAQLTAAVTGVAERLALGPSDVSLSVAPLPHTLGFITTVLVPLARGGTVAFADPRQGKEVLRMLALARPTWCAAAPRALQLLHTILSRAGATWPDLRFLRCSAAPIDPAVTELLEGHFGVPLVSAYAMSEAPGEIASQDLAGPRVPGTVGRPTLCEVEIRSDAGPVPAGVTGEVWISGPNVVTGAFGRPVSSWVPTGDVGTLDDGVLRLTGRRHDVINQGGLKVWPPDVEAVASRHPGVASAVAFPVPHAGLGEAVGLVVVPREGARLQRRELRVHLMSGLPRPLWPHQIVIADRIPLSDRGKVQRRGLWEALQAVTGETRP
jgi:oxalate---CoA ligase